MTRHSHHFHLSLGLLVSFALLVPALEAQQKAKRPALGEPIKEVTQTAADEPLRHGMQLLVTLKNEEKYRGTCVRDDASQGRLLLRTQGGRAPVAISYADIASIRPIVQTKSKNGVIFAAQPGEIPLQPEIHSITINQGGYQTLELRDLSGNLSPAEQASLYEFQNAYNDVAKLEQLQGLAKQMIQTEGETQKERLRLLELYESVIKDQQAAYKAEPQWGYGYLWGVVPPAANAIMPYYGSTLAPYYAFGGFSGFNRGVNFRNMFLPPYYAPSVYTYSAPKSSPPNVNIQTNPDPNPRELYQTVSRDLQQARTRLTAAQSSALYEDGRLVGFYAPVSTGK